MVKYRIGRVATLFSLAALVFAGVEVTSVAPSYAGNCGGHCQAGKMCADMVKRKAIKEQSQRHDEYLRCMRDPASFK
jgi:hypothetical protein